MNRSPERRATSDTFLREENIMKTIATITVCLLLAGSAAAGLPTIGFAVKGGGHWVEDPRETSRSLQPCYEIEIESPAFWGGHVTLVGSFDGTNLDNDRARDAWTEGETSYDRRQRFEYGLNGGRLGVRLWPWVNGAVRPYATIGGGYYQYEQETQAVTTATWLDPKTETMVTKTFDSTRHTRHDDGFYPFASVGTEMAIGGYSSLTGQAHVLIEAQYAWDADFHGADLGGLSVVAGVRFRW